MVAILSSNKIEIKLRVLRFRVHQCQEKQQTEGGGTMSAIGTKPRFGGTGNTSRFGGETAIKYGGGFKQHQAKEKGPTTGLEHVWLTLNQLTAKC